MPNTVQQILLLVALSLVGVSSANAQRPVAGTYQIVVCKNAPCVPGDSSNAAAFGMLILFDTALVRSAMPDSARRVLNNHGLEGPANGCVILKKQPQNGQTYAGGVHGTRWFRNTRESDRIQFTLYRSPDASHDVNVVVRDGRLEGRGRSGGSGITSVDWPSDTVVALRIGAPDLPLCIRASIREWHRMVDWMEGQRSQPSTAPKRPFRD